MPERPDLAYAIPKLSAALEGATIASAELHKPPVLRLALEGTLSDALRGCVIRTLHRKLHFVHFALEREPEAPDIIVAPMLAGCFAVHPSGKGRARDRALTIALEDGRELRYYDNVQMGKVYVLPKGQYTLVPGYEAKGIDVLDAKAFTYEAFAQLASKRRDQVKVFLQDKNALDSFGNAYADEVLFAAKIHPKTFVRKLDDDALRRLHEAIPKVLREAQAEIAKRAPQTDEKVRDFLNVRGKHKQPCPECGTPIRKAGVRGFDAFFCPSCQPETRKSGIVSW